MSDPRVVLFVDNSNIFISAKSVAIQREGVAAENIVRLQFDNLMQLALAERTLARIYVVGSIPPTDREVWSRLAKECGVEPELYERGKVSGGEQGTDQCLQVHMLRAISDFPDPQIAVLMTGDGRGYEKGVGFHADIERMHAAGWGVEVISWRSSCRQDLRKWAAEVGVFVELDDYYDSVTFLKEERKAIPIDVSRRDRSTPRESLVRTAEFRARAEYLAKIEELERRLAATEAEKAAKAAAKAKYDKRHGNRGK